MPRGGKRKGAGAPKKEETEIIGFRIEKVKISYLKNTYGAELKKMFTEWVDSILKDKHV
jgi:hypothetical protein